MGDLFISYARADKQQATLLAEKLIEQGWSVWWDREIPPGKSFDETIENALNSAKCIIVLWSQNSTSSRWVKTEAAEGAERGILVPVLIDKANIPLEFKRIEAADLSDWRGNPFHPEFNHLIKTIDKLLGSVSPVRIKPTKLTIFKARLFQWWKFSIKVFALSFGLAGLVIVVIALDRLGIFSKLSNTSKVENISIANIGNHQKTPEQVTSLETPPTPMSNLDTVKSDQTLNTFSTTQTMFDGVVARVARFEKTGGLVTLELTFENTTSKDILFCADALEPYSSTKIINETTGNSWNIEYAGGKVSCLNSDKLVLAPNKYHVVWMKFKIKEPEVGEFSLSWYILKRPLEKLILK